MEEGYILDNTYGSRVASQWVEGKPEASFFFGAKVNGRARHDIRSFRCVCCGFLEAYAPD